MKYLTAILTTLTLMVSTAVFALETETFTKERFDALQADGAYILVDISATWCPDCKKQHEVLREYEQARPDSTLHILAVDFDTQKEWVTHFKAPRQSTLILFKGTEQLSFTVAETRRDELFEILDTTL